jgi:hypothetical protein
VNFTQRYFLAKDAKKRLRFLEKEKPFGKQGAWFLRFGLLVEQIQAGEQFRKLIVEGGVVCPVLEIKDVVFRDPLYNSLGKLA